MESSEKADLACKTTKAPGGAFVVYKSVELSALRLQSAMICYSSMITKMKTTTVDPQSFEIPISTQIVLTLRATEFHWHFSQGFKALSQELYIPGVLSLLTGIEGSLRFTLYQLKSNLYPFEDDLGSVLSNSLLRQAKEAGIPISFLALPGEANFIRDLERNTPAVRIVEARNSLAHGNIQSFINRTLSDELAFFTPECLRPFAEELSDLSMGWINALTAFRIERGLTLPSRELPPKTSA